MKTVPYFDLTLQCRNLKKEIDEAINKVIVSGKFIMGEDVGVFES